MAELGIVRTGWVGTTGGPGLTQLAFRDLGDMNPITGAQAQAAANAVRAWWEAIKPYIPNEITLTVQPVVDCYDATTGALVASHALGSIPAAVVGTDTGVYGMASGVKVNLNTGVIRDRRRVRGAIYVVPAGQSVYSNTGIVASTAKTAINTASATMLGAFTTGDVELLVWSRPTTTTSNDGDVAPVVNLECNEKTAILRGRRD